MLKRLIIAAVGVVGLVVIGLGIASATVWRADDVLVATTTGDSHTLVTDPGVLELGGDPVTVKITVPDDGTVVLAVGRDTDVAGWVGTDAHDRVTGLSGWHTLEVEQVEAPAPPPTPTDAAAPADPAAPAPTEGAADAPVAVADPTGSDLWVAEETGTGSAELVWPAQEGRWSLLAVSTGESAPTLALEWPRVVTTPWLWPCVAVGTLLVLLAGWLLLRELRRRRTGDDEPTWHEVSTGATPAVSASVAVGDLDEIPVLTRRQLREAAQARAARPRTGSVPRVPVPGTGPVPRVSPPGAEPTSAPATPMTPVAPITPAPVGTSRRSLRPPTGAVPVTPAPPSPTAGAAPRPSPDGPHAPFPLAPAAGAAGSHPAPPSPLAPLPQTTGAAASAASPAAPRTPAAGPAAPGERPLVPPHGRPSWVQGTAGPTPPPPAAAAPAPTGAAGWSPVPPPPGARLRPGSPAGPDAAGHAGRPAWVRTTDDQPSAPDDAATAGSRADAWRRAWGLPPTTAGGDDAAAGADTTEDER